MTTDTSTSTDPIADIEAGVARLEDAVRRLGDGDLHRAHFGGDRMESGGTGGAADGRQELRGLRDAVDFAEHDEARLCDRRFQDVRACAGKLAVVYRQRVAVLQQPCHDPALRRRLRREQHGADEE